ncbi:MAG: bifunctional phosphoribosyl-AMP cyclohydrolase/phosphoribosyl-ATP diphosphatase HisIE [Anaerolineae bacterium]
MSVVDQLKWDEGGLIPAIVQDADTGQVLMLAYMNAESLRRTLETGETWFWSRSRGELWHKGATSGNTQRVREMRYDCDGDALLILVEPQGPACHTGEQSCFYRAGPFPAAQAQRPIRRRPSVDPSILTELFAVIQDRKAHPREGSYTAHLFAQGQDEILKKLGEEAMETILAAKGGDHDQLVYEASDLIYHLLVLLAYHDVSPKEVYAELKRRRKP